MPTLNLDGLDEEAQYVLHILVDVMQYRDMARHITRAAAEALTPAPAGYLDLELVERCAALLGEVVAAPVKRKNAPAYLDNVTEWRAELDEARAAYMKRVRG